MRIGVRIIGRDNHVIIANSFHDIVHQTLFHVDGNETLA